MKGCRLLLFGVVVAAASGCNESQVSTSPRSLLPAGSAPVYDVYPDSGYQNAGPVQATPQAIAWFTGGGTPYGASTVFATNANYASTATELKVWNSGPTLVADVQSSNT